MLSVRSTVYRGKQGFSVSGTLPTATRVKIFTPSKTDAQRILDIITANPHDYRCAVSYVLMNTSLDAKAL